MSIETKELKTKAKNFFKKHKRVRCPAFPKEKIIFNSRGWHHLFYEGKMRARPIKEAETRVILLERGLKLLKKMPFYQEERIIDHEGIIIHYWSLEGIIDERRVKVIVRQEGKGRKCFWSVIPSWRKMDGKVVNAKSDLSQQ